MLRIKMCLLGDGNVGKTSLKRRFFGQPFNETYLPTMGADVEIKTISMDTKELGKTDFKIQIWDLAGQPMYKQVRGDYYKGTSGAFLLFDLTNNKTLENVENWLYELLRYSDQDNFALLLVGNKSDLFYNPPVSTDNSAIKEQVFSLIKRFEKSFSNLTKPIKYIETSALTGENVKRAFEELCLMVFNNYYESIPK